MLLLAMMFCAVTSVVACTLGVTTARFPTNKLPVIDCRAVMLVLVTLLLAAIKKPLMLLLALMLVLLTSLLACMLEPVMVLTALIAVLEFSWLASRSCPNLPCPVVAIWPRAFTFPPIPTPPETTRAPVLLLMLMVLLLRYMVPNCAVP